MSVQSAIQSQLESSFSILHVELVNESHMHSVPKDSETHFKLTLVTDDFEGQNKVKRHQAIYKVLASYMTSGVHALALHTFTAQEWREQGGEVPDSPNCMGGSKKG